MSLQAILAKIETDAKTEAGQILQGAKDQKNEELHQVKSRIKGNHHRDSERIKSRTEAFAVQMKNHALREMEKALLSYRRRIVDNAINESVKEIAKASDYLELMVFLLQACDLTGTIEVVICAEDRNRITADFLKKFSNDNRQFVLARKNHTDHGGIVMCSGDISLNATLSMIAELNHDSMVMELSRQLPLEGQVN